MNKLEKLVNYVRIAPHGYVPIGLGVLAIIDEATGTSLGLVQSMESVDPNYSLLSYILKGIHFFRYSLIGASVLYTITGPIKYKKFKKGFKKYGFKKEYVNKNLPFYCERQAMKAAAYSTGFKKQFDKTNREFPKDKKYFKWVPEL